MTQETRTPSILLDGYRAEAVGVCDIDGLVNTMPEECTLYYSAPDLDYDYGYDYNAVREDGETQGYYIGIDRFCKPDGAWCKEYMLYEYAVFDFSDTEAVCTLLTRHLTETARHRGASRILCRDAGGDELFYAHLRDAGFVKSEDGWMLAVDGAELRMQDALTVPTEDDALTHEMLFFLREQGFALDGRRCRLERGGESIEIDRATAACAFSDGITLVGGDTLTVNDQRSLCLLDICAQLLQEKRTGRIRICLQNAKSTPTTPDVWVGNDGVFIQEKHTPPRERQLFLNELRREGVLERAFFYSFQFDYEVGGKRLSLYYIPLNK